MEIGQKLRDARTKANYTQEQAAEELGISRQTISNWENNKTYPDIISVIKISDMYDVSLDVLLKEEKKTSDYANYLEESTNIVKSKNKLAKIIQVGVYVVIWALCVLTFWLFTGDQDAVGYSLMTFFLVLPVTAFIESLIIGKDRGWGMEKWFVPLFFGIMYMLAEYATFSLANMTTFDKFNIPELSMILSGAGISLVGMIIGAGIGFVSKLRQKYH
ncbi:MAG: helix-turn-helix transcriptional regulator [Lachnospiraceae bacterium]|nr:helix-turn-helix transcriptional regulator [Lachnospiraceae bacterium]